MYFDTVLKNGNFISMDDKASKFRWMGISGGKIAAIGTKDDFPEHAVKFIDLSGRTALPGFIDSHLHGSLTGISLISADLRNVASIEEALFVVKNKCDEIKPGTLVLGTNLNEQFLAEKRMPERLELDSVSKDHPILIHHVSMHGCMLNSIAFEHSGLSVETDGVNLYADGTPNGIISDDSAYYSCVDNLMKNISDEAILSIIQAFDNYLLDKGVTTVHTLDGQDLPQDIPFWHKLQGQHPVHMVNYLETLDVALAKSMGYPRVGGCIALDGSRVMKTVAINEPYANAPTRGILYYSDEVIYKFMSEAHANDMQLSLHVGGERAVDQFIWTLYRVEKEQGFKDLRHRPEHFSMPSDRAIELAAEMRLALPMQPLFTEIWDRSDEDLYVQNFGKERAERFEPLAKIVAAGGIICGGSDCPITECNPLAGIQLAVRNPRASRNVSLTEALKMFTINGAWAAHEENIKGSLEIGKLADLVVLDQNPYEFNEDYRKLKIEMSMVEGKVVYDRLMG